MLFIARSTITYSIRSALFCFVRVPVALAAIALVSIAFVVGAGNPAQGIGRSVVVILGTYQGTGTPGVFAEHLSVCPSPLPAATNSPKAPLPTPGVNCRSEAQLVGGQALQSSIRKFVTRAYLMACALGLAILVFERLYEFFQAHLGRRQAMARLRHTYDVEVP